MQSKRNHGSNGVRLLLVFGAFSLAAGPLAAHAQGWYGGVGFGQSKADVECEPEYEALLADISCSADDSGSAWKLFGGFKFSPNAAIEFSYIDLGEFTIKGTDSFFGSTRFSVEPTGFNIAGVGSVPVSSNFSLLGKIGLFLWDIDTRLGTSIGSASESDSGTDLMFGVGAAFEFTKGTALRVEWERFSDVGDEDTTGESDVDLLSASIVVSF